MGTSEYIVMSALSAAAILLWAMSVWGGWADRYCERYKESHWSWSWLRLAGVDLSRKNRVRFVRTLSFLGIVLVSIGVFAATQVSAQTGEDANPLLGTWEQSRPNGAKMVWEFTATTITFTLIDPSGIQAEPGSRTAVSYRKLERSERGEGYGIVFTDTTGEPGIDMTAFIKDPDTMLLDFPAYGPLELIRVQP